MKFIFYFLLAFFGMLDPDGAFASFTGKGHVHTLALTKQDFVNPDCRATDSCDLKRFSLTTAEHEIWFSDGPTNPTHVNGVIMEYETDSVPTIEKYAIVQFKRGCVFHTARDPLGNIARTIGDVVPSFGENVPFCFPQWVIDSQDSDPVYNSDVQRGRFYLLRWNTADSHDHRTQRFYGVEKPKRPVVYMTDNPTGAFITGSGIKNVALEFKTCIYKAREVPAATRREDIHFATPLACFEWRNVYVYDFARASFQKDLAALTPPEKPAPVQPRPSVEIVLMTISAMIVFSMLIRRMWRARSSAFLVS